MAMAMAKTPAQRKARVESETHLYGYAADRGACGEPGRGRLVSINSTCEIIFAPPKCKPLSPKKRCEFMGLPTPLTSLVPTNYH